MADSNTKIKAIEVLSYSLSYSSSTGGGDPGFEGVLTLADGKTFIFETQSPGLVIATAQKVSQILDMSSEEFEFEARIEEASPDDGLPGPVLYDVTANFIFDDGTTATVEDTDVGPSYPVSFAEALSPADGIL